MPRESCFRRSPHDWQDHVNDAAGGLPDGAERVVANALEFAQVVVERTIEPLIDLVSGLSENFGFQQWARTRKDDREADAGE
jgi:hypothetical protein